MTAPRDGARAARLARRSLTVGATLLPLGLALVGVGPSDTGTAVTLAAIVLMGFGVHSFGRLGPDEGDTSSERRA